MPSDPAHKNKRGASRAPATWLRALAGLGIVCVLLALAPAGCARTVAPPEWAEGAYAQPEEPAAQPQEAPKPKKPRKPAGLVSAADGRSWYKLASDGLHNPSNEAVKLLQQPAEALSTLPKGGPSGNQVDWAKALRDGHIAPRANLYPNTEVRVFDLDIVFTDTAGQPYVVFPHRDHTEWLDCSNCHPKPFISERGANDFSMQDVLNGEYCGRCHGAVSFPLTNCQRCHSRDKPK